MAIPSNYIDKIKKEGESRPICPPADHVRVNNENFEADNLDEVLDQVAEAIDEAADGYNPPADGIPKSDLATAVQESLNLADSSLQPSDKAQLQGAITQLQNALNTLIGSGNVQGAIDTFNEVTAFLNGIDTDDPTLANQLLSLSSAISALQTAINNVFTKSESDGRYVRGISVNGQTPQTPINGNIDLSMQEGADGITPHIDPVSGNWFIGDTDTGVHAQGQQGPTGNVQVDGDGNVLIVNDLTTGGAGAALSAEQGKYLGQFLGISEISTVVNLASVETKNCWIGTEANAKWVTINYSCKIINLNPLQRKVIITSNLSNISLYTFLKSVGTPADNATPDYATGYSNGVVIQANSTVNVDIPNDANYLYISNYSVGDRLPQSVSIVGDGSQYSSLSDALNGLPSAATNDYDFAIEDGGGNIILAVEDGHIITRNFNSSLDIPSSSTGQVSSLFDFMNSVPEVAVDNTKPQHLGQINVIRKALQLSSVKFTPVRDTMPATGSGNFNVVDGRKYYKANTEYTGIPYSSNGFECRAIGSDVSLETFMTAVKNPNSVLYTIDKRDVLSGSLVGAYYGNNCSSFTNAVQGIYCVCYGRNNNFGGNRILSSPKNAEALQIGDVIYLYRTSKDQGHTIVIIGITKDENGFITKIKYAESAPPNVIIREMTKNAFVYNYFNGGATYPFCDSYRDIELVDNLDFTQQFVGVYEESGEIPYNYSDVIGINIGNRSNFNKSDNIPIEVSFLDTATSSSFTLYKGETQLDTYQASSGTSGYGSTKIVTLNKANLDAGTYEVRPSSGVSQYFCVASPGTVSKSYNENGDLLLSMSGYSSNISPYGIVFFSNTSLKTTRGFWLTHGETNLTIPREWLEYIDIYGDLAYFKVVYRNEFGNIYSDTIDL